MKNIKFILLDTVFWACIALCLRALVNHNRAPSNEVYMAVAQLLLLAATWHLANRYSFLTIAILGGLFVGVPTIVHDISVRMHGEFGMNQASYAIKFLVMCGVGAYAHFLVACVRRTAVHLLTKGFHR